MAELIAHPTGLYVTVFDYLSTANVYLTQKHEAISATYYSFNFPDTGSLQVGKTVIVNYRMNNTSNSLTG